MESRSNLYDIDIVEADDEFDLELTRLYAQYCETAKNKSEIELHNYLQEKASQNKKEYTEVISALLYGVLTEPENARTHFQTLSFINRDNFAAFLNRLQALALSIKFQHLKLRVREQIFWLISELTSLNVQNIDGLYLCLLRQVRSGDISQANVILCDQVLKLCESQKAWLNLNPRVIATFVCTYLRVIADHRPVNLQSLQQREVKFTINLLREKWMLCVPIGRDLVRLLQDISSIPEFSQFWNDMLHSPEKLSPRFKGVDTLLKTSTPKEFLRCRLTPEIEMKLLYILQNLRANQYQRNLGWFIQRFLSAPEAESYYVDIIRYLVAGWYPSNQILQSDIVPRYVVIGSMIRTIKSNVVAANVKTALIYDWLFFTPTDNIMFIEPAMLLMERSAERYPYITAIIMEFLKFSVDEYYPPLKEYMAQCVACGMKVMLTKGVIRSLMPIYKCPSIDTTTREYMQELFSEFLTSDVTGQALPSMPNSVSLQSPLIPETASQDQPPSESGGTLEVPKTSHEGQYISEVEDGEVSDHPQQHLEDDDVDLYLYGEAEKNAGNGDATDTAIPGDGDIVMADIDDDNDEEVEESQPASIRGGTPSAASLGGGHVTDPETPGSISEGAPMTPHVDTQSEMSEDDALIEDDELEEEDEMEVEEQSDGAGSGLQANQSYWIFGDSLKKFKTACIAVKNARMENDTEYETQLGDAKRSLKDILAVYLRIAVPAETLVSTIGPSIRNNAIASLATISGPNTSDPNQDISEDVIIADASKDVLDLFLNSFWNTRAVDTSRDKMSKLLACIAHYPKSPMKRHVIGMRWWCFIAKKLKMEEQQQIIGVGQIDWFPVIISSYQSFVKYLHTMYGSSLDIDTFQNEHILADLKMLAEYNVTYFNMIIPLLYQYFSNAMVGQWDTLKLTLIMLLPDQVGKLSASLQIGSVQMFGDLINEATIESSLRLSTYETQSFWQLLSCELLGQNKVTSFFLDEKIIHVLQHHLQNEIMFPLLSLLSSTEPSKEFIQSIIQLIPSNDVPREAHLQVIFTLFQRWAIKNKDAFVAAISELVSSMTDQTENESQHSLIKTFIVVMRSWWDSNLVADSIKEEKTLLASIAKLASATGEDCPKEWSPEVKKKRKNLIFDSDEE